MKTLKFIFKSFIQNTCILVEKQKWWLALIYLVLSLVICVSPTIASGYTANVSTLINTTTETGIDKGLLSFSTDIDETNSMKITDGILASSGKFAMQEVTSASAKETVYSPNTFYTHMDSDKSITTLRVFVLNLDLLNNSTDATTLNNFITHSIYKATEAAPTVSTEIQSSFVIFTKSSIHLSLYKSKGTEAKTAAIGSLSGKFTDEFFKSLDFSTLKENVDGIVGSATEIKNNWIDVLNKAYAPVNITNTWTTVGIYVAVDFAVIFFAGLLFFFFSKGKNSTMKYSFLEAEKIAAFMSLCPAVISAIISIFMSQFGIFLFLIVISFRMMSAVSKINGSSSSSSSGPVYKARS